MVPDEAAPNSPAPEPTSGSAPPRRGRRSGRGRRGRGRRGQGPRRSAEGPADAPTPPEPEVAPEAESSGEPAPPEELAEPAAIEPPVPPEERRPAAPQDLRDTIDHVERIVVSLRESLDDMEEVLETVELAERQRDADQRELDALRRRLSQLQRPREGGHSSHHGSQG